MDISCFLNDVLHGDCLDIMANIPEDSIDVCFADPPFNLKKKYNGYYDNLAMESYISWCEQWLTELVRITKPTGSIFIHNIPKWLSYYSGILNRIAVFRHWIAWEAPTAPMGNTLQPSHYGILFYTKDLKKSKIYELRGQHKRCRKCNYLMKDYGGKKDGLHPFGPLLSDIWTDIHRIRHKKNRDEHPCQLPVHLLERIILLSSDEGDVIFDPFSGTGTTAIAAKQLGRNYICVDQDKDYVSIAKNKLENVSSSSIISGAWVSIYLNNVVTIRDRDWPLLRNSFVLPKNARDIDNVSVRLLRTDTDSHKNEITMFDSIEGKDLLNPMIKSPSQCIGENK